MTEIHQDPYHWTSSHYRNQRYYYHRPQGAASRAQNIYYRPPEPASPIVPRTPFPSPATSPIRQPVKIVQPIQKSQENIMDIISPLFLNEGIDIRQSVQLGRGRYSKVITAKKFQPGDTGTTIAIKVINTMKVQDDFVKRFLPREIDCWRQLNHPHLVKILGHYESLGYVFLTMEYGSRGDLLHFVQKNGPLAENLARKWLLQLFHGVAHMHWLGIAHRDLKLENVVIFEDGFVKVADFGFSRKMKSNRQLSATFCGSRSYSAPEVLLGKRYCPFKSDVWSLGIIAFIMMTDRMPFAEKLSTQSITLNQRAGAYHYPIGLSISDACKQMIAIMLTYEPACRPHLADCLRFPFFTRSQ